MGVWIETNPTPAAGLGTDVTPFVGVWIETTENQFAESDDQVTPFVGVWIETLVRLTRAQRMESHTLRGCVD